MSFCRDEKMLKKKWFHLSSAEPEELIFCFAVVTALALGRSRYDYVDGNPIPVLIFNNKPSLFHAFLISLCFGFTAAVVTMSLRDKSPRLARFCRRSAVACVVVAAGLVSYSALLPYFYLLNSPRDFGSFSKSDPLWLN